MVAYIRIGHLLKYPDGKSYKYFLIFALFSRHTHDKTRFYNRITNWYFPHHQWHINGWMSMSITHWHINPNPDRRWIAWFLPISRMLHDFTRVCVPDRQLPYPYTKSSSTPSLGVSRFFRRKIVRMSMSRQSVSNDYFLLLLDHRVIDLNAIELLSRYLADGFSVSLFFFKRWRTITRCGAKGYLGLNTRSI